MNNDTITDYIFQRLSEAERLDFEQQMATDAALKQEVAELKAVWETLENAESTTDKVFDEGFYQLLESEKKKMKTLIFFIKTRISPSKRLFYINYITVPVVNIYNRVHKC